jgi:hypothetical protein
MKYTIVDRNLLVPQIIIRDEFFDAMEELQKITWKRDLNYISNVYLIKYSGVRYEGYIQYDGEKFYEFSENNGNKEKREINLDYSYLYFENKEKEFVTSKLNNSEPDKKPLENSNSISIESNQIKGKNNIQQKKSEINISPIPKSVQKQNLSSNITDVKIEFKDDTENLNNLTTDDSMSLLIKPKNDTKIIIEEKDKLLLENDKKVKLDDEKEKKKEELLKICEQVMDMYNLELNKIKKTELNLLTIDNKIEKLIKKKREKIFENITRTKNEFETWKKIKYNIPVDRQDMVKNDLVDLVERENPSIPILFTAKYNYIEKIIQNKDILNIFNILNKLDLSEIYVKDELDLDPNIIKFVEKYTKISKKDLHYNFDHDWDYLDNEFEKVDSSGFLAK